MNKPLPDVLRRNRLLALLDDDTLAAVGAAMTFVPMKLRDPVMTEGKAIRHAWFPVDGVISMLGARAGSDRLVEVATIGNEGMAGLPLLLGRNRAPGDCFVQVAGHACLMTAADFQQAAHTCPAFTQVLHRYTQALLVQASQGSACNRTHSPLERCARWLLMTDDRVAGNEFMLIQEFLAQMLGERRPTVSRVASQLQARRIIDYSRGRITVLDRKALEDTACPCYRIIRDEFDELLSPARARPGRKR